MSQAPHSRLRQAYELLESILQENEGGVPPTASLSAMESHWNVAALQASVSPDGLLSYQELLGVALGQMAHDVPSALAHPAQAAPPQPLALDLVARLGGHHGLPTASPALEHHDAGPPAHVPGRSLPLSIWPQDCLSDEVADAAVETLYDFLHAVGRRDLDVAMELVAQDYHTLEQDIGIDRRSLRLQLERWIDPLRDWQLEFSLSEAPEPLFHPLGVMIDAGIRMEAFRPRDEARRSLVSRRLVLLRQELDGTWKLLSAGPIDP